MPTLVTRLSSIIWKQLNTLLLKSKEVVFSALKKMPLPAKIEHLRPKSLKDLNANLITQIFNPKNWSISEILNAASFLTAAGVGITIVDAVSSALGRDKLDDGINLMIQVNQANLTSDEKKVFHDAIVATLVKEGYDESEIIDAQKASNDYLITLKDEMKQKVSNFLGTDEVIDVTAIEATPASSGNRFHSMKKEIDDMSRKLQYAADVIGCSRSALIEIAGLLSEINTRREDYKALC